MPSQETKAVLEHFYIMMLKAEVINRVFQARPAEEFKTFDFDLMSEIIGGALHDLRLKRSDFDEWYGSLSDKRRAELRAQLKRLK